MWISGLTERFCSGACCRAFPLPYGPEELNKRAPTVEDGEQIADMVIHLGEFYGDPQTCFCHEEYDGTPIKLNYYTCKNLTPKGNCDIYGNHPRMCKRYPDNEHCMYSDYGICNHKRKEKPKLNLEKKIEEIKEELV